MFLWILSVVVSVVVSMVVSVRSAPSAPPSGPALPAVLVFVYFARLAVAVAFHYFAYSLLEFPLAAGCSFAALCIPSLESGLGSRPFSRQARPLTPAIASGHEMVVS